MVIHFFCAAAIVSLVLLQRGKGADAGAGFGAGASGTVFGARGATTALSRATAILAALFMITSLSLAYVGTHKSAPSGSILEQLSQPAKPAPATGTAPALGAPSTPATAPPPTAPPAETAPSTPASPSGAAAPGASGAAPGAATSGAANGAASGGAPPGKK